MALKEIGWDQVEDSSNVAALFHHEPTNTICVRFRSGGLYSYMGGDHEMFMSLKHADSVGRYLNNVVKALPYTRWVSEDELLNYLNIE
jgi:KTSC domain